MCSGRPTRSSPSSARRRLIIQNMAVGGVSNPIAVDSQSVLTVDRLMAIKTQIDKLGRFR